MFSFNLKTCIIAIIQIAIVFSKQIQRHAFLITFYLYYVLNKPGSFLVGAALRRLNVNLMLFMI